MLRPSLLAAAVWLLAGVSAVAQEAPLCRLDLQRMQDLGQVTITTNTGCDIGAAPVCGTGAKIRWRAHLRSTRWWSPSTSRPLWRWGRRAC